MSENNQTKSNGRGGARIGAGRKPGTANTKTREIADKAASEGVTPLEVMLTAMRFHFKNFEMTESPESLGFASMAAKDAAPYIHPKLGSVQVTGDADKPLQTVTRIELVALSNDDSTGSDRSQADPGIPG